MKSACLTFFLISVVCHGEELDVLRFKNGDELHGVFSGVTGGGGMLWKRGDVGGEVEFKTSELRQIGLQGGRKAGLFRGFSHVGTVNGDRIPGKILSLDEGKVVVETEFAGVLELPRGKVGLLAPNPLGGRMLYNGPFAGDEWSMLTAEHPEGVGPEVLGDDEGGDVPLWKFARSAWYWQNKGIGTALVRKVGIPDRASIRFDLAWKNRLAIAVAFHADFTQPKVVEEVDGGNGKGQGEAVARGSAVTLNGLFGSSYVLQLYNNYVMLYRTTFDEKGRPQPEQVRSSMINVRLLDSGKASVELRCNRQTGEIVLFIDGQFVAQWSEIKVEGDGQSGYAGLGEGLGFVVLAADMAVRISEIAIGEWNGMPDAARSMQTEDADVVLLTNGTDRLAGEVKSIVGGRLTLESRFGKFEFPMEEIAEVRFARMRLEESEDVRGEVVGVRFPPIGRISGKMMGGGEGVIELESRAAGRVDVKLGSAVMLEFETGGSFLDDWDEDF